MTKNMYVEAVAANIRSNPAFPRIIIRRRMNKAHAYGGHVCGAEIAKVKSRPQLRYKRQWRAAAAATGRVALGTEHETPISIPVGHRLLHAEYHHVHGGSEGISPARGYMEVQTVDPYGHVAAVVAVHPVNWWYKKKAPHLPWRKEHAKQYFDSLSARVVELAAAGIPTLVVGDWNCPTADIPHLAPGQVNCHSKGLDHIVAIPPKGGSVGHVDKMTARRTAAMDHPILWARVYFNY